MGVLLSLIKKKDPKTPIKGIGARLKNIILIHHKGVIGSIVPLLALPWLVDRSKPWTFVFVMWLWMIWFFLWHPVNVPVSGLIPIFMLPMTGTMSTDITCRCYMNEGIILYILGNMLLLLWNNSGLDRRLVLWFLCSGDTIQFSSKRMLFKCCTAGFFLSMFSNRLIVCSIMMQYVTPVMTNLQAATSRVTDPNYDELRYILNNAIHTSCAIGSIGIIHSSFVTLAFRAIFYQTAEKDMGWHDIFNYLEYSIFAFPLALLMLIMNIAYHIVLITLKAGKPMSQSSMGVAKYELGNKKKEIPSKITLHEKLTLFFSILSLFAFFFRWNKYVAWSSFKQLNNLPLIRDATVAALFVILLHSLPNGFKFVKIFTAKKKSQLGVLKPESAILWWRFVDKNINYGYFFVIGSGVALSAAIRHNEFDEVITKSTIGKLFNSQDLVIYLLLVCLISVVISNAITGVATCVVILPFIMNMHKVLSEDKLQEGGEEGDVTTEKPILNNIVGIFQKEYLGALAVGIGSNFGFMFPFLYTPAYFSHYTGKVPKLKMIKYGVGSSFLCFLILWVAVSFYAPMLWNRETVGQELLPTTTGRVTTTQEATPPPDRLF